MTTKEDITQRLIQNADKIRYLSPREAKYDGFEGLGEQLPTDSSILQMGQDKVIKVWGYSLSGFNEKKQRYARGTVYQFVSIQEQVPNTLHSAVLNAQLLSIHTSNLGSAEVK